MKLLILLCLAMTVAAQPQPRDVFREYAWSKPDGDAGGSLRVGGRLDYGGGPIPVPHSVDLTDAVRAEVVIEKLLCHDGTRGLAIALNGREPIVFPEAEGIPVPPWDYQYFTYPVVQVPLAEPGHNRESGVNPELPRSGKRERTPRRALVARLGSGGQ